MVKISLIISKYFSIYQSNLIYLLIESINLLISLHFEKKKEGMLSIVNFILHMHIQIYLFICFIFWQAFLCFFQSIFSPRSSPNKEKIVDPLNHFLYIGSNFSRLGPLKKWFMLYSKKVDLFHEIILLI